MFRDFSDAYLAFDVLGLILVVIVLHAHLELFDETFLGVFVCKNSG